MERIMSTTTTNERSKLLTYGSYFLMVLLTLGVGVAGGLLKFVNNATWTERFINFGYPLWFMYLIGIIEIAAAVALWIPKTRALGSLAIMAVMIGALISNLIAGESIIADIFFFLMAGIVAWIYRDSLQSLFKRA